MRLPQAPNIRRQIAETAAELSSASVDRYLSLLGEVEPTVRSGDQDTSWRLASYHGSHVENDVIERAITIVQRNSPLMRIS